MFEKEKTEALIALAHPELQGGGSPLDALVARAFGWQQDEKGNWRCSEHHRGSGTYWRHGYIVRLPGFTQSIDAALDLHDNKTAYRVGRLSDGTGIAFFGDNARSYHGRTPAIALCVALLLNSTSERLECPQNGDIYSQSGVMCRGV